jgi:MFS family permease
MSTTRLLSSHEPWGAVLALGVTQITAWGTIYYLFALLMEPLQAALGASKSTVVGAFTVSLLISGVLAPFVGRSIDRRGGRVLMAAASLLAAGSLVALAHVQTLPQLYLAWALLGVAMAGTLYEPAFAVVTRAFVNNHRRAIAVLTLFGGFASTVFWPLGQTLISALGWRDTAMIFGALNLAVCVPLHLFALPQATAAAPRPSASGTRSQSLGEALHDPTFYLLAASFTVNALVFSGTAVHMLAMLAAKGLTAGHAAALGALIGPMQVVGRLAEMAFGQRVSASSVGMIAMGLLPLSLLLFVLSGADLWSFVAFALLYGAGNGVMTIVRGTVPVELYGRDHYGAVNGAMAAPVLVAKAAGPLVAAIAWTLSGDYDTVALWLASLALTAMVFFTLAVRRRRLPSAESSGG